MKVNESTSATKQSYQIPKNLYLIRDKRTLIGDLLNRAPIKITNNSLNSTMCRDGRLF